MKSVLNQAQELLAKLPGYQPKLRPCNNNPRLYIRIVTTLWPEINLLRSEIVGQIW
jgi:hypothetical protein